MSATSTAYGIRDAIRDVIDGVHLTTAQAEAAMNQVMSGDATPAQIASLVTALRMRGETVDEIAGFARAMRSHALRVEMPEGDRCIDIVGTGGDGAGTFNISTTAALVVAGAGVRVAKHGNRSITSQCGSADLLEGLGVRLELSPEGVARCIREAGMGFMFAPMFHPGFRHAGPTRREIGIRTVFNVLGPLTNPAGVTHQLIGVGSRELGPQLAAALGALGSDRVVVVHSVDGYDELGLSGSSEISEYDRRSGKVRTSTITPEEVGLDRAPLSAIQGGDPATNVAITRAILGGERGPRRDVVLLNAGAALFAADAVTTIRDGIAMAAAAIDDGRAQQALERLVAVSQDAEGAAA